MKRLLAALLALLLLGLAAPALGAAHARVSGRLQSPALRPAPPACRDNHARNALGRCPAPPACPDGRAREPGGQCPTIFCAGGVLPDAFGRCHARLPPRWSCPGGGLRTPAGDCPTPPPCPGGLTRNLGGVCPFFAPRYKPRLPLGAGLALHRFTPAPRPPAPPFTPHLARHILSRPAPHMFAPTPAAPHLATPSFHAAAPAHFHAAPPPPHIAPAAVH